MIIMILAALMGWGLILMAGVLFGSLAPGALEIRTDERRRDDD